MTTKVFVPEEHAEEIRRVAVAIEVEGLYPAYQAALILGIQGTKKTRQNRMYAIPRSELPRYGSGPSGRRWLWRGGDLLEYRERKMRKAG